MEIVSAIFEHGRFRPETPVELPEGSRVVLAVERQPGDSSDALG